MDKRSRLTLAFAFGLAAIVGVAPLLVSRFPNTVPLRRQLRSRNRETILAADSSSAERIGAGDRGVARLEEAWQAIAAGLKRAVLAFACRLAPVEPDAASIIPLHLAFSWRNFSSSALVPLRC